MLESRFFLEEEGFHRLCSFEFSFNDMTYCSPAWLVNNRNVFLTILGMGGPRSRSQQFNVHEVQFPGA